MVPFIRCQHGSKLSLAFTSVLLIAIMVLTSCSPAPASPASPFITASTSAGPSAGEVNQTLTFSTNASSNMAGSPKYRFDWGDGSYSGWSPSPSASHSWSNPGTYTVRAQARHPGVVSDWSGTRSVTITLPSSSSTSSMFLEAPAEVCPGEEITVQARVPRKCECLLRVQKIPCIESHTDSYPIDWVDAEDNLVARWHCVMPLVPPGKYELQVIPAQYNPNIPGSYFLIRGDLLVKEPDSEHLAEIIPRSLWNPEIMKFYVTPDDPAVKAAVADILSRGKVGVFNDFEALRDWVGWHISYRSDQEVHGERDYWQLPAETLKLGTGDCEDFATLLCSLLRAYGVPSDRAYVAVGRTPDKTYGHAYLVEKWYQGIWRVTEPTSGAWPGVFLMDWATSVSFETLYCFNDQNCLEGLPTLPPGVYEFQLSFTDGASATFERYMSSGQMITASVEWLGKCGNKPEPFTIFGWGLRIYDPNGCTVLSWFGGDLFRSFSFAVPTSGKYKVQVYIGGVLPVSARLTIDPPDWSGQ